MCQFASLLQRELPGLRSCVAVPPKGRTQPKHQTRLPQLHSQLTSLQSPSYDPAIEQPGTETVPCLGSAWVYHSGSGGVV